MIIAAIVLLAKILLSIVVAWFPFIWWQTFLRGEFRFVYNPVIAPHVRKQGADGTTIGARCYVAHPGLITEFPSGLEPVTLPWNSSARRWWRHEKRHNRQFRVRPFMGPVYLFWELAVGWKNNPLEIEAEREEDTPEPSA